MLDFLADMLIFLGAILSVFALRYVVWRVTRATWRPKVVHIALHYANTDEERAAAFAGALRGMGHTVSLMPDTGAADEAGASAAGARPHLYPLHIVFLTSNDHKYPKALIDLAATVYSADQRATGGDTILVTASNSSDHVKAATQRLQFVAPGALYATRTLADANTWAPALDDVMTYMSADKPPTHPF